MVLHNPNNWHWVNKDVRDWAREYLEVNLVGLSASEGDVSAKISKIVSMDGDVDVSQRKGKVITLFDVKLQLEYEGKVPNDDENVGGTITVPEVAHDTEEDEYVFEVDIYNDTAAKAPIKPFIREKIIPQLRQELAQLGPALITEHGKDLQHATGLPPSTKTTSITSSSTAAQTNAKPNTTKSAPKTTTMSTAGQASVNTCSLSSTEEFRTTAAELYKTFTSPERLAAFTRAPPKLYEGTHLGAKFELFGGNISGEYITLEEPRKIVEKWRLGTWPEGHYSNLEIVFDQNDRDAVTVMRVEWTGVPVGEEEVVRRNWGEFYVRSIKTTFGFGTVL